MTRQPNPIDRIRRYLAMQAIPDPKDVALLLQERDELPAALKSARLPPPPALAAASDPQLIQPLQTEEHLPPAPQLLMPGSHGETANLVAPTFTHSAPPEHSHDGTRGPIFFLDGEGGASMPTDRAQY